MSDIKEWLNRSGFGDYADIFERERVEIADLADLTDADLAELGMPLGPRKRFLRAVASVSAEELDDPEAVTPRPRRDAERRQLTVMFCDLADSTALSEQMDPEDLRVLLRDFQTACGDVVTRYDGHVAQYLGDGLMIYFGWPRAHDDDAERAVRTGLDIVAAVQDVTAPEPLKVRVGIATGPVVVGETGEGDASVPKMAVGETPNLAARAQGLAGPDQVVIASSTQRLAGTGFDYEDLGEQVLKGIVDPVHCWRVVSVRRAKGDAGAVGADGITPFIGRDAELANLIERLAEAERGRGQVVVLTGDPGIGKSRLLAEFRRRAQGRAAWAEGRCISFGQSMAFHPLVDLMRKNFGVDEDDGAETIREKVSTGVARVSDDLAPCVAFVQYMLGVAEDDDPVHQMDPQVRRAETFDVLRRLLLLAAERKPQVLVFEDLHWSDTATTEFLRYIFDSVPASRVLLLATLRAGYASPFEDRSYVTRLALHNLTPEESTRIAEAVLSAADLPRELQALIHRKAEGNPFFVEELVKSLRETEAIRREGERWVPGRPLDQIVVPDTVQGVLMSRIDRLEDDARRTLQLASVIGREFTQRLLDRIADLRRSSSAPLQELQAIELIYQKALYPELAFMFKHALAQDVAYGSLLVQRRRELHLRVAEAIEELYSDRLDEHYAMIAHHFAAAEDWGNAVDYFDRAADQATAAFAVHEAIALTEQTLEALRQSDADDASARAGVLHGKLAHLYTFLSDFERAHEENEKAAKIAREAGDAVGEGWANATMGIISFFGHAFDRATAEARKTVAIGHDTGNDDIVAAGLCAGSWVETVTGNLDGAYEKFERCESIASPAANFFVGFAVSGMTLVSNWQGNYECAVEKGTQAVAIARTTNQSLPLMFALFSLGLSRNAKGDHDQAMAVFNEGLALAEKLGDEIFRNRFLNALGAVHADCGDIENAITLNERARDFSAMRGDPETIANAELNLGDAFLIKTDRALACEMFDGVHKIVGNPETSDWMKWRYSQHLCASYGEACVALDDLNRADEWANQCLDLAARTDSKKYLVRGWRLKASIDAHRLNWEDAEESLRRALALAEKIGNPTQLWRTQLAMSRLFADTKQADQARAVDQAARNTLDRIGESLRTATLRSAFNDSPLIKEAYALSSVS